MSKHWPGRVGDVWTFTKQVSEADMALFALITRADDFVVADPAPPIRQPRQPAPFALLASLLAAAAVLHVAEPARIIHQQIVFLAPLYTDDTFNASAEVTAFDEAEQTLYISVVCQNQEGASLARGELTLSLG